MRIAKAFMVLAIGVVAFIAGESVKADECVLATHQYISCPTGSGCTYCNQAVYPCRRLSYAEKQYSGAPCTLCFATRCDTQTYSTDPDFKADGADLNDQPLSTVLEQLDDADLHKLRKVFATNPVHFEAVIMLLADYSGDSNPVTLQIVGFNPGAEPAENSAKSADRRPSGNAVEQMRSWFQTKESPADGRVNEYVEAELIPSGNEQLELTISSWPTSYIEQDDRAVAPRLRSVVIAQSANSGQALDYSVQEATLVGEN